VAYRSSLLLLAPFGNKHEIRSVYDQVRLATSAVTEENRVAVISRKKYETHETIKQKH